MNIDRGEFKALLALTRRIFGGNNAFWRIWKTKNKRFNANRLKTKKKKSNKFEYIILARKGKGAKLGCILDPRGRKQRALPSSSMDMERILPPRTTCIRFFGEEGAL